MGQYLNDPLIFLIEVVFGLYVTVVLLRFLFQLFGVDFYNPICRLVVKITNPPLRFLRPIVPGIGKIDVSSIILMLTVQYVSFILITLIIGAKFLPVALLALSAVEIINHTFNIFIFSVIILAIFSWISSPYQYNPVVQILHQLTQPVMRPIQKLMPPVSGIDLSPMLALIGLFFFKLLIIPPLRGLAGYIPA